MHKRQEQYECKNTALVFHMINFVKLKLNYLLN